MNDKNFNLAAQWFEALRNEIVQMIEEIDGKKFIIKEWDHLQGGGGKISKINGNIIEKGGVNISSVLGSFDKIPYPQNFLGPQDHTLFQIQK